MYYNWINIHKITKWVGGKIAYPFKRFGTWYWVSPEEDVMDEWSFAHAFASALLTIFAYGSGASLFVAWLFGNLIMLSYELFIDGNKLEDPRGAQESDLGYNFMGTTLTTLACLFGSFWITELLIVLGIIGGIIWMLYNKRRTTIR